MLSVLSFFSFFFVLATVSANHIQWAIENGAYLNPALEYRDGGMYATGPIAQGVLLARIPVALEFPCQDCSHDVFTDKLNAEFMNPDSKWKPYLYSLPTDCQNPLCSSSEIDLSAFTLLGALSIRVDFPVLPISNRTSLLMSRKWESGLRPLLDLFNHNEKLGAVVYLGTDDYYYLNAKVACSKGEQVYDSYGPIPTWKMYLNYGFIDHGKELICNDQTTMRIGNDVQRVACLAYCTSTLAQMVEEMGEAVKHNDVTMLKGAAQWIDRDTKFQF
jgi:hypothetical protein